MKLSVPIHVSYLLDVDYFADGSEQKFCDALNAYFASHKEYDGLDVKAVYDGHSISIEMDGTFDYDYYPGSPASWDYPGDPDDFDGPFELSDLVDYANKAIKACWDPSLIGDFGKDDVNAFIANCEVEDSNVPEGIDDIYQYLPNDEPDYPEDWFMDSVMKNVLSGKGLTESITERAGDWDIESDEIYSKAERDAIQYDVDRSNFEAWKKKAAKAIENLSQDYADFIKVIFESPYSEGFEFVKNCPLKNPAKSNLQMQSWLGLIAMYLNKKTFDEEE